MSLALSVPSCFVKLLKARCRRHWSILGIITLQLIWSSNDDILDFYGANVLCFINCTCSFLWYFSWCLIAFQVYCLNYSYAVHLVPQKDRLYDSTPKSRCCPFEKQSIYEEKFSQKHVQFLWRGMSGRLCPFTDSMYRICLSNTITSCTTILSRYLRNSNRYNQQKSLYLFSTPICLFLPTFINLLSTAKSMGVLTKHLGNILLCWKHHIKGLRQRGCADGEQVVSRLSWGRFHVIFQ